VIQRGRFEDALANLSAIFQERGVAYALMGGLAVAAWGAPRATEDIDLLADLSPSQELDAALRLRSRSGPEIDVVCATRAWEREMLNRSIRLRFPQGLEIPVEKRATARGVLELLRQVRASSGD